MPQTIEKPAPKKRRPSTYNSTACDQCFRRKVRCNSERPICGNCQLHGSFCTSSASKVTSRAHNESRTDSSSSEETKITAPRSARSSNSTNASGTQNRSRRSSQLSNGDSRIEPLFNDGYEKMSLFEHNSQLDEMVAFQFDHFQDNRSQQFLENLFPDTMDSMITSPLDLALNSLDGSDLHAFSPIYLDPPQTYRHPQNLHPPSLRCAAPAVPDLQLNHNIFDEASSDLISKLYECEIHPFHHPVHITLAYLNQGIDIVRNCLYSALRPAPTSRIDCHHHQNRQNLLSAPPTSSTSAITILTCIQITQQVFSCYLSLQKHYLGPDATRNAENLLQSRNNKNNNSNCERDVLDVVVAAGLRQCKELATLLDIWVDEGDYLKTDSIGTTVRTFVASLRDTMEGCGVVGGGVIG